MHVTLIVMTAIAIIGMVFLLAAPPRVLTRIALHAPMPVARFLSWISPRGERIALANDPASGRHVNGIVTKRTDGAYGRNLLVKFGSDAAHVALSSAADIPYGVLLDESTAAEDPVQVQILGSCGGTILCITDGSAALVVGDYVVPVGVSTGKVTKLAAGAGNYYIVGRVLEAPATTDGEQFEVIPLGCYKTQ